MAWAWLGGEHGESGNMKKKTTKKRNPNDSTFRNINALKKRVKELEQLAKYILARFSIIDRCYMETCERILKLEERK